MYVWIKDLQFLIKRHDLLLLKAEKNIPFLKIRSSAKSHEKGKNERITRA